MINSLEGAGDVVQVMEFDVSSQTVRRNAKDSLQSSEVHEYSINLLRSEAGVAVQLTTTEKMTKITTDMGPQKKTSEYSGDLQNSLEIRSSSKKDRGKNDLNDDQHDQALTGASKYSEYSMDFWWK